MTNRVHAWISESDRLLQAGFFILAIAAVTVIGCQSTKHSEPSPVPPASDEASPQTRPAPRKQKMDVPPAATVEKGTYGTPSRLKGENLAGALAAQPGYRSDLAARKYGAVALMWLDHYRDFFKLTDPRSQMRVESVKTDSLGTTHVRLLQVANRVPVWQKGMTIHFNGDNAIYLFQGDYLPAAMLANVDLQNVMSAGKASAKALAAAQGTAAQWQVEKRSLVIYAAANQPPRPAYVVILSQGLMGRDQYIVDAVNGKILDKSSLVRTGGQPMKLK